jgi:hypothetical protein
MPTARKSTMTYYVQIDDEVREATPEEAARIEAEQNAPNPANE